ncbi:hypothetical protein [Nonomuraea sp. NPDC049400]|uniref:hypothetical protein n=1 Tax=Nonomuraea sp. NPDC049400 TaxID=3364352 RepID=UPI0037A1466F
MTALERMLTKALAEIVIGLDHSGDDAIAPEAVMPLLEPIITLLDGLSGQDPRTLVDLITNTQTRRAIQTVS